MTALKGKVLKIKFNLGVMSFTHLSWVNQSMKFPTHPLDGLNCFKLFLKNSYRADQEIRSKIINKDG